MAAYRRVDDLTVTCRLTACTPGSVPGPTLGIEYGKPLPFLRTFATIVRKTVIVMAKCCTAVPEVAFKTSAIDEMNLKSKQGDQSGATTRSAMFIGTEHVGAGGAKSVSQKRVVP